MNLSAFAEDFRIYKGTMYYVQNSWRTAIFGGKREKGEKKEKERKRKRKKERVLLPSSVSVAVLDLNTGLILRTKRHTRGKGRRALRK